MSGPTLEAYKGKEVFVRIGRRVGLEMSGTVPHELSMVCRGYRCV